MALFSGEDSDDAEIGAMLLLETLMVVRAFAGAKPVTVPTEPEVPDAG